MATSSIVASRIVIGALLWAVPFAARAAEPLLDGLGTHTRKVTTPSRHAQKYFDQGLRFYFGFNHGAAVRSFREAARLDPQCAMAHWGIALASGPHINNPVVPPPAAETAWAELGLAQAAAVHDSPVEQALIKALAQRYANHQPEDRKPLDQAYAEAMRQVWRSFPEDADVGALFAEAMMDLRPWDQWTPKGQPQEGTEEILTTLEAVLKLDVDHPFANHLYIHAVEASPHPERALPMADRLLQLQPGLAHNVHMPSHIYIRTGRWQAAVDCNLKAVAADARYRRVMGPAKGFLPVYVAHNEHMLTYAAMMSGQANLALAHIHTMAAGLSEEFLGEFRLIGEAWLAMPLEVEVRFGRWDQVLAEPAIPAQYPFSHAFRSAARAIAFAAKGDTAAACKEQAAYLDEAKAVPADELVAGNDTCQAVFAVVTPMVDGEILIREGKTDSGIARLREAIQAEDELRYDEPPGWLIPVRHSLGATLMRLRRYAEAEQVYRDDLARLPNNGWSLFGLGEALGRQHKDAAARVARSDFRRIWKKADIDIHSSCLCQPGA